ncbi:MAG TPA: flavin reductase family protein [Actinomycetota bacterium]|nr:flavin reductase family protein [Actinomycetota bacterium]
MASGIDRFLDKLDFPLYVVTASSSKERSGCMVGFLTQCSMEPVRLLVCISEKNHTHEVALESSHLAVHLVPAERTDLVDLFGSQTGYDLDKFSLCEWSEGPGGVPLLDGCPSRLICTVLDRTPVGDHTALLVEALEGSGGPERPYMFGMAKQQDVEPGQPP